uniref:Uncharacterized protein n=1 Tax=Meloidogyne incognita TaxID=6306 RepID=A0A914LHS4_MELIC
MKLSIGKQVKWRCRKSNCRCEVNMRVGNWLEGSRLPYVTIVRFLYCWSFEYTSGNFCQRELGIDPTNTTVDWNNYLRCICVDHLIAKPHKFIGRVLPQQWIFGGLCRESDECFLVQVPDRSAKTLMAEIEKHISPGR